MFVEEEEGGSEGRMPVGKVTESEQGWVGGRFTIRLSFYVFRSQRSPSAVAIGNHAAIGDSPSAVAIGNRTPVGGVRE